MMNNMTPTNSVSSAINTRGGAALVPGVQPAAPPHPAPSIFGSKVKVIGWLDREKNLQEFLKTIDSRVIDCTELDLMGSTWGLEEIRNAIEREVLTQVGASNAQFRHLGQVMHEAEQAAVVKTGSIAHADHQGTRNLEEIKKSIGVIVLVTNLCLSNNSLAALIAGPAYNTYDAHVQKSVNYLTKGRKGTDLLNKVNSCFLRKCLALSIYVICSSEWAQLTDSGRGDPEVRKSVWRNFTNDVYLLGWLRYEFRGYLDITRMCSYSGHPMLQLTHEEAVEGMDAGYVNILNRPQAPWTDKSTSTSQPLYSRSEMGKVHAEFRQRINKGGLGVVRRSIVVDDVPVVMPPGASRNDTFKGTFRPSPGFSYDELPGPARRCLKREQ